MKKRKLLLLLVVFMLLLTGCSKKESDDSTSSTSEEHPTLTLTTRSTSDYHAFLEALHEVYPEVNIELISYAGYNTTEYSNVQLKAQDISDIFVMSYAPVSDLQKNNLLDLSGYDFISNINAKSLSDLSIDGAVYLLPTSMSLIGCYYNKTLFEEHGWSVPNSLEELEALIPQIEAAGVKVSEYCSQFDGAQFGIFFDTNAPEYFTTLEGISWIQGYLNGTEKATGNLEGAVERYQHLVDIGFVNVGETPTKDSDTKNRFKEGNTAFLVTIGSMSFTENDDGTGDQYAMLPFLSEDGSNNTIVATPGFYIGLNKNLADDPAKLEDALKVMSFIASSKGQKALATNANQVSPIAGETLDESSPLYEMSKLVDEGKYMNMIYSGWEDYVVGIGKEIMKLLTGEITGEELLTYMDELQSEVQSNGGVTGIAEVEETLDKKEVAQIVGAAFAEATGADCALISIGDYHPNTELDEDGHAKAGYENSYGVNGKIYAGLTLDEYQTVSTFNPLNANSNISVMTLTGKQIKEYAQEGYFNNEKDTTPFEYVLVTKEGTELDDDTTYTVAVSHESDTRAAEGNLTETECNSREAIVNYIKKLGVINSESVIWK